MMLGLNYILESLSKPEDVGFEVSYTLGRDLQHPLKILKNEDNTTHVL